MGIGVETTTPKASVSTPKIRAAIVVENPLFSASVVIPIAQASSANAVATTQAVVPVPVVSSIVITYSAFVDSSGRTQFKFEQVVVTDALQKISGKAFGESVGVSDLESFSINKGVLQEVFITDAFDKKVAFSRTFPELLFATDARTTTVGKDLSEEVLASENLAKSIHKFLEDAFVMEDTASAGDGSTFSLAKYINELLQVSETLFFSFGKPLADSLAISDTSFILFTRPLTDTVSVADTADISFVKGLADTVSAHDLRVVSAGKVLSEALLVADSRVFNLSKPLSESVLAAGEPTFGFSKPLSDGVSLGDLRQWLFSRPLADGISLFDAVQLILGKGLADSVGGDDVGSLISQGYTENNTYFLEDFVGESRTFT